MRRDLLRSTSMSKPQHEPSPAVSSTEEPQRQAQITSAEIERLLAEMGRASSSLAKGGSAGKSEALTFAISVTASLPPGYGSFTRIENGEMKVLWAGRLAAAPSWPANAKLWLHRSDYDQLIARTEPL